jgi:protein gp37
MTKRATIKDTDWWTDNWDLLRGCTPVGAGCKFCWLRDMMNRFDHLGNFDEVVIRPQNLGKPMRARKPRIYATCLMGDLFHEQVPPDFILSAVKVISGAPKQHFFVLLTKRWGSAAGHMLNLFKMGHRSRRVILMGSAWDDISARAASDQLRKVEQVGLRWGLHLEPLLGAVSPESFAGADWIVVGGENNRTHARPMDPRWVMPIMRGCDNRGVAFWFKGHGNTGRWCPSCNEFLIDPSPGRGPTCGTCMSPVEYRRYKKNTGHDLGGMTCLERPWEQDNWDGLP